jgi:large subunit ribosomal protein L7e
MKELGLRQINNAVFLRASEDTLKKLVMVNKSVSYGKPSKKIVNEIVRKRGFLRKGDDNEKLPITNNVLIEDLLGPGKIDEHMGCICVEDVIDTLVNC